LHHQFTGSSAFFEVFPEKELNLPLIKVLTRLYIQAGTVRRQLATAAAVLVLWRPGVMNAIAYNGNELQESDRYDRAFMSPNPRLRI
jgi:hypothetical protein